MKSKKMKSSRWLAVAGFVVSLAASGLGLLGWSSRSGAADNGIQVGAAQAMPARIEAVKSQDVQIWKNFSGHVVAVDRAEIRPQVSGRITDIQFEDGQHVEKGDVLFVIDPRPYEATLAQAKAALQAAQTQAALAEKEYQRAKSLIKNQTISQSLLDERLNKRQTAAAAVQGAKALVESAQINLDYAHVKTPISGKISRAEITVGNLVQSGSGAPLLTSVVADEHVYVDFEVDERTYIGLIGGSADGALDIPVRVRLVRDEANAQAFEYKGFLKSFDNRIDPASGTIRARALFDNAEKRLLPGMSVSVLMGGNGGETKILIPERAIGTDQDRKFVYVVDENGMTQYREIRIGDSVEGRRVVLSGLQDGEKIIADGLMRIRPGMVVSAKVPDDGNGSEPAGEAH